MHSVYPYVFALLFWILFFSTVHFNLPVATLIVLLAIVYSVSVLVIGRAAALRQWNVWLNFFLYLLTCVGLALVISSPIALNLFIIVSGFISGAFVHFVRRHARDPRVLLSKLYLEFISFVFLITFWQAFALLFFMLISYDASVWYSVPVALVLIYVLGRGIIYVHRLVKSSHVLVLFVLTVTTVELYIFLELLPLHYYVLATLLALWFYFVVQMVLAGQELLSRRRIFKTYTLVSLIAMIVLLLTARWG